MQGDVVCAPFFKLYAYFEAAPYHYVRSLPLFDTKQQWRKASPTILHMWPHPQNYRHTYTCTHTLASVHTGGGSLYVGGSTALVGSFIASMGVTANHSTMRVAHSVAVNNMSGLTVVRQHEWAVCVRVCMYVSTCESVCVCECAKVRKCVCALKT